MSFFVGAAGSGMDSSWGSAGSWVGASGLMSISMSASMAPSRVSLGCGVGSGSVDGGGGGGGSVIVKEGIFLGARDGR